MEAASGSTSQQVDTLLAALTARIKAAFAALSRRRERAAAERRALEAAAERRALDGVTEPNDKETLQLCVGGQAFSVRRSVLRAVKGSVLAEIFSGRWDGRLLRHNGQIFLDVDPTVFRALLTRVMVFDQNSSHGHGHCQFHIAPDDPMRDDPGLLFYADLLLTSGQLSDPLDTPSLPSPSPSPHHAAASFLSANPCFPPSLSDALHHFERIARCLQEETARVDAAVEEWAERLAREERRYAAVRPFLSTGDDSVLSVEVSVDRSVVATSSATMEVATIGTDDRGLPRPIMNRFVRWQTPIDSIPPCHFNKMVDLCRRARLTAATSTATPPTDPSSDRPLIFTPLLAPSERTAFSQCCDMYGVDEGTDPHTRVPNGSSLVASFYDWWIINRCVGAVQGRPLRLLFSSSIHGWLYATLARRVRNMSRLLFLVRSGCEVVGVYVEGPFRLPATSLEGSHELHTKVSLFKLRGSRRNPYIGPLHLSPTHHAVDRLMCASLTDDAAIQGFDTHRERNGLGKLSFASGRLWLAYGASYGEASTLRQMSGGMLEGEGDAMAGRGWLGARVRDEGSFYPYAVVGGSNVAAVDEVEVLMVD
ncbi:unnamed protein product [Vitrella brassicaformis CCMP3155]|uniref:Potassium channel tetramerisation-type BTB domain-containing protein n=1 Tax=Vitrella brassicaformis (strain CCMP3155) TaxID=1169540 RepID=A0A0G4FD20_VITBC|nr:unnamed protein product [Vitrella brassicaformis CCMP3155]|eukprot:CEM10809.1 unnamed protein product [Vitrella brassicaformis CCMP3155]